MCARNIQKFCIRTVALTVPFFAVPLGGRPSPLFTPAVAEGLGLAGFALVRGVVAAMVNCTLGLYDYLR